ncbi:hypothetical protein CHS0354_023135 [Potamilus streckersoni]|uniref:TIR domain-containing protein n=1 Tax=Potamilus streckersoni TaxID=2493646 RepID=A0AAE0VH26_9BIVA|nr:hypothetical protein CHS0354_023135 [Potamilus streckersoni]
MTNPFYFYDYRVRFKCYTIGIEELYIRYSNIRWLNITLNITLFNLKVVDLEGNSIEYLSPELMEKAPNLREIYLSRNILSSMVNLKNLFEGNAKLEIIDLSQNRLTSIPWSMFVATPSVSILRLQGNSLSICDFSIAKLTKLKLLDLSDNMIKYISKATIDALMSIFNEQTSYKNTKFDTNGPKSNYNKTIYKTNNSVLLGINQKLKRSRKYERALMERYIHKENDDRQRYFVFLSYAGRDDELVNNYIYPVLEKLLRQKFGNKGNLICTGDTHFTPGRWVAEEIDRYLNRCDVFVMVLTKHFIESEWCKYEVMLAKQKNKLKILLVNDEVYRERFHQRLMIF